MTLQLFGCRMTAADYEICREMLASLAGGNSPLLPLLREKVQGANIVSPDRIDAVTVTLNSRVEFRLDDEAPQKRILVGSTFQNGLVGLTLPLSTVRGLALLGLREGQRFRFIEADRERRLVVDKVLYQPEAKRRPQRRITPPEETVPASAPAKIIDFAKARNHWNARSASSDQDPRSLSGRKGTSN